MCNFIGASVRVDFSSFQQVVGENWAEILLHDGKDEPITEVSSLLTLMAQLDDDTNYVEKLKDDKNNHPKVQEHKKFLVQNILR